MPSALALSVLVTSSNFKEAFSQETRVTYKRVIIKDKGGPELLEIIEEELPEPAPGEVRVKVMAAGVAFGDIMWQTGTVPGSPKPPYTPGYDVVGVVDKLGAGVSAPAIGQTVTGLIKTGGYAEYVCRPADKFVPVPDGLDLTVVAALTLNYLTAYQLFERVGALNPGKRALVHGAAGGLGTAMLQVGQVLELEMYGTASKAKHDLVASLGATPIDYRGEDFVERIYDLTADGVDMVVDHIGGSHFKRSFRTLRDCGILVGTSSYNGAKGEESHWKTLLGFLQIPLLNVLPNGKSAILFDIVPFNNKNPDYYASDLRLMLDWLAEGTINPVIAKRLPLIQARQAQELILGAKVTGKVVLVCNGVES